MGTFQVEIEIGDPQGKRWEKLNAIVGTRATFALIPRSALERLQVRPEKSIALRDPDGRLIKRDIGQTWLRIGDKSRIGMAVFGDEGDPVLVGTNTLEGMLLEPDFQRETLVPAIGLMPSRHLVLKGH